MRAANLHMLDNPGKDNPPTLQRSAETVRTHLYDPSRLGESHNADIAWPKSYQHTAGCMVRVKSMQLDSG